MNKICKILIILLSLNLTLGCSKDYLDTVPTASTATATIFETVDNVALALNGINSLFVIGYHMYDHGYGQWMYGEGGIKMLFGNYPGNHYEVDLAGWSVIINGEWREINTSAFVTYPWYFYYSIISNANAIIVNVDNAKGAESEKKFLKAQALTYRAYSYFMLSQIYCYRWSDSNNGSSSGLVLRLDTSTDKMPLSTLGNVYTQIYKDLDDAIALYTASGKEREFFYDPDISVAYAIYARAAITRQDYPKALTMAQNAKAGYPLMGNADYTSGFNTPTSEWIWGSFSSSDENQQWSSFFAYHGYNSNANAVRTTPKCISKELFNKIPATDIRRTLFLDPAGYTPGVDYVTSNGKAVAGKALYNDAFAKYPDLFSTALIFTHMNFKFKALDLPGVGNLNHIRSSEMYLIEAEAKYFLTDYTGAQNALKALNRDSGRDPVYNCTKTGSALLEEIKLYRAIELWGEGFDWFDLKRWGDSISRKSYAEGGNFISAHAITQGPEFGNKWTWVIPNAETDYNDLIE